MKVVCNILYNQGVDIFFIPMHQPEDRYFLEKMPSIDIPIYKITQELSVEEVVALTGQMDLVIGMRLHALIMAVAQGVPVVGLSYDPKVTAFMKMIDEKKCFDVERFEPEVIANCVLWQLQNIQRERISMEEKRKLLVQKVYEPAKMIQTMLGN